MPGHAGARLGGCGVAVVWLVEIRAGYESQGYSSIPLTFHEARTLTVPGVSWARSQPRTAQGFRSWPVALQGAGRRTDLLL